jgi:uncharacterized protein YqhQ
MRGKKLHRHIVGGLAFTDGVILHTSDAIVMAMRESNGEVSTKYWPAKEHESAPYLAKMFGIRGLWLLWRTITLNSWLRNFVDQSAREMKHTDVVSPSHDTKAEPRSVALSLVPFSGLFLSFIIYMLVIFSFVLANHISSGTVAQIKSDILTLLMLLIAFVWIFRASRFWDYMGYHGAQHQVIAAYEDDKLSEEGINSVWPFQWRCGAAVVSYTALALVGAGFIVPSMTFFESLAFALILFSLSYELVMLLDNNHAKSWVKIFFMPGVVLQLIVARHPNTEQSQVALSAMQELAEKSKALQKHSGKEFEGVLT